MTLIVSAKINQKSYLDFIIMKNVNWTIAD